MEGSLAFRNIMTAQTFTSSLYLLSLSCIHFISVGVLSHNNIMKQIAAVYVVAASCSCLLCFVINITMLFFVKRQVNRVAQSLVRATISTCSQLFSSVPSFVRKVVYVVSNYL